MVQLENFQQLRATLIINAKRFLFSILMYRLNGLYTHTKHDDNNMQHEEEATIATAIEQAERHMLYTSHVMPLSLSLFFCIYLLLIVYKFQIYMNEVK